MRSISHATASRRRSLSSSHIGCCVRRAHWSSESGRETMRSTSSLVKTRIRHPSSRSTRASASRASSSFLNNFSANLGHGHHGKPDVVAVSLRFQTQHQPLGTCCDGPPLVVGERVSDGILCHRTVIDLYRPSELFTCCCDDVVGFTWCHLHYSQEPASGGGCPRTLARCPNGRQDPEQGSAHEAPGVPGKESDTPWALVCVHPVDSPVNRTDVLSDGK